MSLSNLVWTSVFMCEVSMSSYIDVKFRVDGVNVKREDSLWKLPYNVESYPNHYDEGYSVLVDVKSADMVKVMVKALEDNGYGFEFVKKKVSV